MVSSPATVPSTTVPRRSTAPLFWLHGDEAPGLLADYVATTDVQRALYDADPRNPATQSVLDQLADDVVVATFEHSGALTAGSNYGRSEDILLAPAFQGLLLLAQNHPRVPHVLRQQGVDDGDIRLQLHEPPPPAPVRRRTPARQRPAHRLRVYAELRRDVLLVNPLLKPLLYHPVVLLSEHRALHLP